MTAISRLAGVRDGLAVKAPCRLATTAHITLSGLQVIDGVQTVAGDRVLVKNQTDAKLNGIYVASSGLWTRAKDFDGPQDVVQYTRVIVGAGNTNASLDFQLTTVNPVIGTSALTFAVTGPVGAAMAAPDAPIDRVLSRTIGTPPSSPAAGDSYIVRSAPAPTGAWVGKGGQIARWSTVASGWVFYDRPVGHLALVVDENRLVSWDGTSWDSFIKVGKPGGVSVTEFGATPNTVDSIEQIEAAQAYAVAAGYKLIFPYVESAAYYVVSRPIIVTERDQIETVGGWGACRIYYTGASCFEIQGRRVTLRGFNINGSLSTHPMATGIRLAGQTAPIQMVKISETWFEMNKYGIDDQEYVNPIYESNTVVVEDCLMGTRGFGGAGIRLRYVNGSIHLDRCIVNQAQPETGLSFAYYIEGVGGLFMHQCSGIGGNHLGATGQQHGVWLDSCAAVWLEELNVERFNGVSVRMLGSTHVRVHNSHAGACNGDAYQLSDCSNVTLGLPSARGNNVLAPLLGLTPAPGARGIALLGACDNVTIRDPIVYDFTSHAIAIGSSCTNVVIENPRLGSTGSPNGGSGVHNRAPTTRIMGGSIKNCDLVAIDSSGGLYAQDVNITAAAGKQLQLYTADDEVVNWRNPTTRARANAVGPVTV